MRFRFDLHTHTFYLKDTCNSPEEMIAAAVKRGLNGIAITDQDSCGAHEHLRGKILPPHFLVVPGVEVGNRRRPSSLLGATLPYMKGRRAAVLDTLDVNALEVFNAAVTSRSYNNKSRDYASRRGWQGIAASDAHHASAVGIASTVFEMEELSVPALLDAIRRGGNPEGDYLSFREGLKKHFANWFRIVNRRPDRPR
jgi:predicted metal-dependent phosphoesterase TrpH